MITKESLVESFLTEKVDIHKHGTFDSGKVYHISTSKTDINSFTPRVPSNAVYYEDKTIPRVSAAKTIYGCIRGITIAPEQYKRNESSTVPIYEYTGEYFIPDTFLVPDSYISGEVWILKKPKFKEVGSVFFHKDNNASTESRSVVYLEITLNGKTFFEAEGKFDDVLKRLSVKEGFDINNYKTFDQVFNNKG